MDEGWVPNTLGLGLYSNKAEIICLEEIPECLVTVFSWYVKEANEMTIILLYWLKKKKNKKINIVDGARKKLN
jgi:hypothetical protein